MALDSSIIMSSLPAEVISKIEGLIFILKISGFLFMGYILFLAVKAILDLRGHSRIKKINQKVDEIDRKLNILLKKQKKE